MPYRLRFSRIVLAVILVTGWTGSALAQVARVSGTVKDEQGEPIKGATIRAENQEASLRTITAATDDKGRFSIIGLARGGWTFVAEAPGFAPAEGEMNIVRTATPNPPLVFTLKKARVIPPAAIEGLTAKDLQVQLTAADGLYNQQKFDEAIAAYRAITVSAPSMAIVNLQIAAAYRQKKDYDRAIAAYNDLLKADPNNDKAKVGVAMTNVDKGDRRAAEQTLTTAAEAAGSSREVFYSLAEIKATNGQAEEAAKWYQKAAEADGAWGKPLLKLGLIAMRKGDKGPAATMMQQVIAIDPTSPEAAEAKTALDQLK